MKPILLLLLLTLGLAADDVSVAKAKIRDPVVILFELTVINKDKNTKETVNIQQSFTLKEWEKTYRPLTLLELKSYEQHGYIRALPVIVTIQTL